MWNGNVEKVMEWRCKKDLVWRCGKRHGMEMWEKIQNGD